MCTGVEPLLLVGAEAAGTAATVAGATEVVGSLAALDAAEMAFGSAITASEAAAAGAGAAAATIEAGGAEASGNIGAAAGTAPSSGVGSLLTEAGKYASAVNGVSSLITGITGAGRTAVPGLNIANPKADQAAIDTQAAQDAEKALLDQKRRARANSLLSSYGAAGDTGAVTTGGPARAVGKLSLGA